MGLELSSPTWNRATTSIITAVALGEWRARRDSKRNAARSDQVTEGRPVEATYSIQLSYGRVAIGLYRLYILDVAPFCPPGAPPVHPMTTPLFTKYLPIGGRAGTPRVDPEAAPTVPVPGLHRNTQNFPGQIISWIWRERVSTPGDKTIDQPDEPDAPDDKPCTAGPCAG